MNASSYPRHYRIRVRGHPDDHWFRAVDTVAVTYLASGESLLVGWMSDQSALYGLLNRIGDLGLDLLAVDYDAEPPPLPGIAP